MHEQQPSELIQPGDALIVVDVQPDFCPGGRLAIAHGDEVIPVLNAWLRAARDKQIPIYASRDWHPQQHVSFKQGGGEWPPHCVQDSPGAEFHPDLELPPGTVKIAKGTRLDRDQYSAFDETGLALHLRQRDVKRLWVGGLAEDVCVLATALDGRKEGFDVRLIAEATRPVTLEGGAKARAQMRAAGVIIHEGS
ncbi:nicotinamidase [Alkalilimnicola ehrlichii]|uniref:nicotinamidase n=1 Tax=Alkalilimnicola ehrlichii TaxID=351052 RepID=UPI000E2F536F|nr:nicotinamidase [Alkalilimnicola ehrlichii]RFA25132.1 nicotinamidase [Alkalilimnicola ehrlichii]